MMRLANSSWIHGQKVTELMKQKQYAPMSVAPAIPGAVRRRTWLSDDVELNKIVDFEAALLSYANTQHADLMAEINAKADYNDDDRWQADCVAG